MDSFSDADTLVPNGSVWDTYDQDDTLDFNRELESGDDGLEMDKIIIPSKDDRKTILWLLSQGMSEVPFHRQGWTGWSEQEKFHFLMSLGPRFDSIGSSWRIESIETTPLAGELWELRDRKSGQIISVKSFLDPGKTYRAGEWKQFYEDKAKKDLPEERTKWDDVLWYNASEMLNETSEQSGIHLQNSFYLAYIATHPDYQSRKCGTKLLSELTSFSNREKRPIILFTSTDRAVNFYTRAAFTEPIQRRYLPGSQSESIPLSLMTYIPEGWQRTASSEHISFGI